jgi:hypothetical protein
MLTVEDFEIPVEHPFGLLEGYKNVSEKEDVLAYVLTQNIIHKNFYDVPCGDDHTSMILDGLLWRGNGGKNYYALTEKAKGLLYSVYHKKEE